MALLAKKRKKPPMNSHDFQTPAEIDRLAAPVTEQSLSSGGYTLAPWEGRGPFVRVADLGKLAGIGNATVGSRMNRLGVEPVINPDGPGRLVTLKEAVTIINATPPKPGSSSGTGGGLYGIKQEQLRQDFKPGLDFRRQK